jgi:DNA primase
VPQEWRPDPQEPRLILEREVLKARLQAPALAIDFTSLEPSAFTHPAYQELRAVIDQMAPENTALTIDKITNENMKSLFTELNVEPIRADGEITEHYVASIIARLREVSVSRAIAELKSSLQRLNPVENEAEYNAAFAQLVALESTRRTLHDLALGGL